MDVIFGCGIVSSLKWLMSDSSWLVRIHSCSVSIFSRLRDLSPHLEFKDSSHANLLHLMRFLYLEKSIFFPQPKIGLFFEMRERLIQEAFFSHASWKGIWSRGRIRGEVEEEWGPVECSQEWALLGSEMRSNALSESRKNEALGFSENRQWWEIVFLM